MSTGGKPEGQVPGLKGGGSVNRTFRRRTAKRHGRSEEMLGAVQRWGSQGVPGPDDAVPVLDPVHEEYGELGGRAGRQEHEPES